MKSFIENSIKRALEVYRIDPNRIRSDYRIEEAAKKSYRGREIFELIQNADDEMANLKSEGSKQISITFKNGYLSVSNNGTPFDKEGIESLMLAYNSDKPDRQHKEAVIGNKGTGFRAVLSWAKRIVIHSGDFHIAFSSEHSQQILRSLPREIVKNRKAATLAFPEWIGDRSYDGQYTTTIGLDIYDDDDSVKDSIREQLDRVDGEALLFLNNATSIVIKTESSERIYRKASTNNKVYIETTLNGLLESKAEWVIRSEKGVYEGNRYSISVAYKTDGSKPSRSVVYCFLPTDIYLPLPLLLHASLELDDARNHLIKDNDNNDFILQKAVRLIAIAAEERTGERKSSSYDALSMCLPYEKTETSELSPYEFWTELSSAIETVKVFPTVNNKYISCNDEPVIYEAPIALYLHGEAFSGLLRYTSDPILLDFLMSLENIKVYTSDYLRESINNWAQRRKYNDRTVRENSRLIKALCDENIKCDGINLVYGKSRKLSKSATNPIYVNTANNELNLPDFIRMTTIDPYMERTLRTVFDCDLENLVPLLSSFNVRPYEPVEVVQKMETAIKRHLDKNDDDNAIRCVEKSLVWIHDNFNLISDCSIDFPVYVINRSGEVVETNKLYLGREYGNEIVEDLFRGFERDIFVAPIADIVNDQDTSLLKRMLIKIGVSESLRNKYINVHIFGNKNHLIKEFSSFFWSELDYPIRFGYFELNAKTYNKQFSGKIHTLEHLEWILEHSDTGSIIRLVKNEPLLRAALKSRADKESEVWVLFDPIREKRNLMTDSTPRKNSVPSYIAFLFNNIPWINVDGIRYKVSDCIIEDIPDGINNILVKPETDKYIADDIHSKGQSRTLLRKEYEKILSDIGVNSSFAGLKSDKLYEFLNELAANEYGAKVSKTIYRRIYDDYDEKQIDEEDLKQFITNGFVLCQDGLFYHPKECRYLDRRAFCKVIKDRYHLFDIRTRLSSTKIQDIFGVNKLEVKGELLGEPAIHPINDLFQRDFENYKICAFCYRYGNNKAKERDELSKFKNLNIVICKDFSGKLNDDVIQFGNYDYITSDNKTYYLCLPLSILSLEQLICHDVGDAISSIVCDMLDLSDEKTALRDLYMKSRENRLLAVRDEAEEVDIYERALKELGSYENNREEFISILNSFSPHSSELISSVAEIIDFDHFNSYANAPDIIRCLRLCELDVDDYNELSVTSDIDLTEYYNDVIRSLKPRYEKAYTQMVYRTLSSLSIAEKVTFVDRCFDYYEKISISVTNSAYFNPEEELISQLGIEKNLDSQMDIDEVYKVNIKRFEEGIVEREGLDAFYSDNEITSLVYFGEFDELSKRYESHVEKNKVLTDIQEFPVTPDYSLNVVRGATKPSEQKKRRAGRKRVGFKKESEKQERNKATIGLNGEKKVFYWLREKYGVEAVDWVSENAKHERVNPMGSAGNGYDIKYRDGENEYLVDVKATSSDTNELSFYMSSFELNKAIENEGKYQIFFVTNANGEDSRIIILDNIIKDGELNKAAFLVESKVEVEYKLTGIVNRIEQEINQRRTEGK